MYSLSKVADVSIFDFSVCKYSSYFIEQRLTHLLDEARYVTAYY